jgi:hypothetical protein
MGCNLACTVFMQMYTLHTTIRVSLCDIGITKMETEVRREIYLLQHKEYACNFKSIM